MGLKLRKVVDLTTPHLHTKFEISRSLISDNIPVQILSFWKNGQKRTLFWSANYTSMELWTWNLACLCTLLPNIYMYTFKSQSHWILKIWLNFVTSYNKKDQKLSAFWSVKYTYYNYMVWNFQRKFIWIRRIWKYNLRIHTQISIVSRPI